MKTNIEEKIIAELKDMKDSLIIHLIQGEERTTKNSITIIIIIISRTTQREGRVEVDILSTTRLVLNVRAIIEVYLQEGNSIRTADLSLNRILSVLEIENSFHLKEITVPTLTSIRTGMIIEGKTLDKVEVLGVEAKIVGVDSDKMIEVNSETVGALEEGTVVDSEEEEAVVVEWVMMTMYLTRTPSMRIKQNRQQLHLLLMAVVMREIISQITSSSNNNTQIMGIKAIILVPILRVSSQGLSNEKSQYD
jgi:hypothetical protein